MAAVGDAVIGIAIVGMGKIARDQHVATILNDSRFRLAATVDPGGGLEAIPTFPNLRSLLSDGPRIDAVAICTPPQVRADNAVVAIEAGLHVLLEKPPAPTVDALEALRALAAKQRVTLYAAWHSRHAPMVQASREWLAARPVKRGSIVWRENVHYWHPGQTWLQKPGGFGVFDPGINALSILTQILPRPVSVESADLEIPKNWHTPIAARLSLITAGAAIATDFDLREDSPRIWNIEIEAESGETLSLREGGDSLSINGGSDLRAPNAEYKGIYRRFADLIAAGQSDVDTTPLQLVADAFLIARTTATESFEP
jgi:D-galactose 1-dehydrogenase